MTYEDEEGPPRFGNDGGMQPNENAAQQLTEPQQCQRCGKQLTAPYNKERFICSVDATTTPNTIDSYGFACLDCQRDAPDFDWYEED